MLKKTALISAVSVLLITACATAPEDYAIPQAVPLTEQEKQEMTCRDIAINIQSAESILKELAGGESAVRTGAGMALGVLGATVGAFNTAVVGRSIAHNTASKNTQTRLDELQALAQEKVCTPEELNIGETGSPEDRVRVSQ